MTDHSELRRLAEAAIAKQEYSANATTLNALPAFIAMNDFRQTTNPARILALLDEIEALKRERQEAEARGYARAKEQAAKMCVEYMQHEIAYAIRAMEDKND